MCSIIGVLMILSIAIGQQKRSPGQGQGKGKGQGQGQGQGRGQEQKNGKKKKHVGFVPPSAPDYKKLDLVVPSKIHEDPQFIKAWYVGYAQGFL